MTTENLTSTAITKIKRAEAAARDTEEKYRNIFQASPIAIELYDAEGRLLEVNDACLRLFGVAEADQVRGFNLFEDPNIGDDVKKKIRAGTGVRYAAQFDFELVRKNGLYETSKEGLIHLDVTVSPLVSPGGSPLSGYMFQIQDVTDRARAEEKLKFSEEKFLRSFMVSPAALCIARLKDFRLIDINDAFVRKSGFTREEVLEKTTPELMVWENPEDRQQAVIALTTVGQISGKEFAFRMKDGRVLIGDYGAFIITISGEKYILVSIIDITDRKRAEERVRSLLAEKELLLKEVHHRIKNNMGTMMSLLALQAGRVTNEDAKAALENAAGRMRSMGILYDKLNQSNSLREIPINAYLSPLVDEIVSLFPGGAAVKVEKEIGDFMLGVKMLSPLGLIVNELITNIMKYAFPDGKGGTIRISASKKGTTATLAVEDSGNRLPADFDIRSSTGFGLGLVAMLVRQIGGTIRAERGERTRFVVEFDAGEGQGAAAPAPSGA